MLFRSDAKFRALMPASGMGDQAIEAALARIRDLRGLDDVSRLVGLIRP